MDNNSATSAMRDSARTAATFLSVIGGAVTAAGLMLVIYVYNELSKAETEPAQRVAFLVQALIPVALVWGTLFGLAWIVRLLAGIGDEEGAATSPPGPADGIPY